MWIFVVVVSITFILWCLFALMSAFLFGQRYLTSNVMFRHSLYREGTRQYPSTTINQSRRAWATGRFSQSDAANRAKNELGQNFPSTNAPVSSVRRHFLSALGPVNTQRQGLGQGGGATRLVNCGRVRRAEAESRAWVLPLTNRTPYHHWRWTGMGL